jgi:PAS domain S-box-containing protein
MREGEERFRTLANLIPAFVWFTDAEGKALYFNNRWYEYTGQTCQEALGFGSLAAVHSDDIERMLANWKEAKRRGVLCENEFRCRRHDGTYRWFMARIEPQRDEAGQISGWFGASTDVHDRKIAEASLRESEARLQAAVSLVGLGLYAWDPRTDVLNWDARLKAMWGLSPDTHRIDHDVFLAGVHPDDRVRVEKAIATCIDPNHDGVYDIEYRVLGLDDGVERWVATRGLTTFQNREAVGLVGVALEITDRKRTEASLRHLNETLERRVAERTLELEHANQKLRTEIAERNHADSRLQQMQLELYRAARLSAAGQMAAALAHELNQPLTAVATSIGVIRLQMAKDEPEIDMIEAVLDETSGQALRAGQIIRRLRDFVARGDTERRFESLATLIEDASALALVDIESLGVKKHLRLDPKADQVIVDRIQIQQVLVNLMRNALEAMAGSMRRDLTVATVLRDDGFIEIAVADSGSGIPNELADHLFEPFFSTKRNGMGLGLSICRSIIEAHGGRLRYEPNAGGGCVFRFTLSTGPTGGSNHGSP